MYRPDGWKNPYFPEPMPPLKTLLLLEEQEGYRTLISDAYEAGADAMLEGLKKEAFWIIDNGHKVEIQGIECFTNGRLLFIPEDDNAT